MADIKGDLADEDFNKNSEDGIGEDELGEAFKTLLVDVKDEDLKTLAFITYFTSFNTLLITLIISIVNTLINDLTFLSLIN